jgi:uncharacterized protein YndB with AHSA1/START domain
VTDDLGSLTRDGNLWSVRYERTFNVRNDELWKALTNVARITEWMLTEAMDFDPRVGGSVHYFWGGTDESKGTISVFDPPRALEYSWNEGASTSMVRFELREIDEGSVLTLHHDRITSDDIRGISAGWHTHLEILQALFSGDNVEFRPRFDALAPIYDEVIERT